MERILKHIVICLFSVAFLLGSGAQAQAEGDLKGKLQGKVSSLIPRTKQPTVSGKKFDFSRLVPNEEEHAKLIKKLTRQLSDEELDALRKKKLNRYGAAKASRQSKLNDVGTETLERSRKPEAKPAKEPEEDGSSKLFYFFAAIFAGAMFVCTKARS